MTIIVRRSRFPTYVPIYLLTFALAMAYGITGEEPIGLFGIVTDSAEFKLLLSRIFYVIVFLGIVVFVVLYFAPICLKRTHFALILTSTEIQIRAAATTVRDAKWRDVEEVEVRRPDDSDERWPHVIVDVTDDEEIVIPDEICPTNNARIALCKAIRKQWLAAVRSP